MKNKRGDKIISVYWFAILFIVASAVVYMAALFYGAPYDVRGIEAEILTDKVADCLSQGGYLKEGVLGNEAFENNFLDECNLNFEVEEAYGWEEQEQYYLEINFYEFDQSNLDSLGERISKIVKGNVNLKTSFLLEQSKEKDKKEMVVLHYTAGSSLEGAEQEFEGTTKSIHYIVGKDGTISKGENENEKASHAGCGSDRPSCSKSPDNCCIKGINKKSIGIELVNLGYSCDVRVCANKIEIDGVNWEKYPDAQMDALVDLVSGVVSRHNIPIDREHIIGHDEVDPGRKVDPGPAFPWDDFITRLKAKEKLSPSIGRSFYVLDRDGNQYIIQILVIVGKNEKNAA